MSPARASHLHDLTLDLAWSLWTELGVPGVVRRHQQSLLDPEPIVLGTAWIAQGDPRLRDLVVNWCAAHHRSLSTSRLRALAERVPAAMSEPFDAMSRAAEAPWSQGSTGDRWPTPEHRATRLDPTRPAMAAFRARALCGVGTRADVLLNLRLIDRWSTAMDLNWLGYSKRNIALVLHELGEAGFLGARERGRAVQYRVQRAHLFDAWIQLQLSVKPPVDWLGQLTLAHTITQLAQTARPSTANGRVLLARGHDALAERTAALDLTPPPPDARASFEALLAWGTQTLAALAHAPD